MSTSERERLKELERENREKYSDHGSQYLSIRYTERMAILSPTGRVS
jgi:hypothetical protein